MRKRKVFFAGGILACLMGCSTATLKPIEGTSLNFGSGLLAINYFNSSGNNVNKINVESFEREKFLAEKEYVESYGLKNNSGNFVEREEKIYSVDGKMRKSSKKYYYDDDVKHSKTGDNLNFSHEEELKNGSVSIRLEEKKGDSGKVFTKSAEVEGEGKEWEDELLFDNSGNLFSEVYKDGQGVPRWGYKYGYQFDEKGNVVIKKITSLDGKSYDLLYINKYNGEGKITSIQEINKMTDERSTTKFDYNASGALTAMTKFNDAEEEREKHLFDITGREKEIKIFGDEENVVLWKEFSYDSQGKIVEEKILDTNGEVVARKEYLYRGGAAK